MPNTYVALRTETLAVATPSVTFSLSGISGYTDLVVVMQTSVASGSFQNQIQLNGDTGSNYSTTYLSGNGSAAISTRGSNATSAVLGYDDYNTTAIGQMTIVNLMNYSNSTTNKTILARGSNANTGVSTTVSLWRNTAAITSILIKNSGGVNYAVGSTFSLYGIANADQGAAKATGGIITEDSQYWYHTFGASGTFTPKQALTVDYLVVAGGGGGGGGGSTFAGGGGGGAGGLRCTVGASGRATSPESPLSLASGTPIAVTVGAGGTGGTGYSGTGVTNGSNSIFSTITSTGGGRGGSYDTNFAAIGGSGGGAGGESNNKTGAAGTTAQGFGGGNGQSGSQKDSAGGGGGSGSVGIDGNATTGKGGNGGAGTTTTISGTSVTYAGGGGGGGDVTRGDGLNGGGNGGVDLQNGFPGTANTGGGGGGCGAPNTGGAVNGAAGGSGIVIVRYAK
jgi:hypothetical protein